MITRSGFQHRVGDYRDRVDRKLAEWLNLEPTSPARLAEAMQYAVLGPGKRIRPLLAYACAEVLEVEPQKVDAIAVSVELVHAYSLIHDDLPAMDDDDLRRGRATTHKAFGEANAILAGDALQALAFQVLLQDETLRQEPAVQVATSLALAEASGPRGMVGGQVLDLSAEGVEIDQAALEDLHQRKTGRLIQAAVQMPTHWLPGLDSKALRALDRFSLSMGLAFQVRDDLLEVEQDTETLGKSSTSDQINHKSTFPSLLGVDEAREYADELFAEALAALDPFESRAEPLQWMADYIVHRNK